MATVANFLPHVDLCPTFGASFFPRAVGRGLLFLSFLFLFPCRNDLITVRGFGPLLRALRMCSRRRIRPITTHRADSSALGNFGWWRFFYTHLETSTVGVRCTTKEGSRCKRSEPVNVLCGFLGEAARYYIGRTFSARGPLGPSPSSYDTSCPT